jgi:hypothetical protein
MFVGLYIQQICMAGLFFLARDQNQDPSSTPQAILMVALIALTVSSLFPPRYQSSVREGN